MHRADSICPDCDHLVVLVQTTVKAILSSTGFVNSTQGCESPVGLVLESTSFYAEQGGQVADVGSLASTSGRCFHVQDAQVSLGLSFRCTELKTCKAMGSPIVKRWVSASLQSRVGGKPHMRQRFLCTSFKTLALSYVGQHQLGMPIAKERQKCSCCFPATTAMQRQQRRATAGGCDALVFVHIMHKHGSSIERLPLCRTLKYRVSSCIGKCVLCTAHGLNRSCLCKWCMAWHGNRLHVVAHKSGCLEMLITEQDALRKGCTGGALHCRNAVLRQVVQEGQASWQTSGPLLHP